MTVTIVKSLPEALWRRFVDEHPEGNVYHTPEVFQAFAATHLHQPRLWAAVDKNGRPLALLLPVQVSLFDGPFRSMTTRAVVYGGVLYETGATGESALAELLTTYRRAMRGMALFTELRNITAIDSVNAILASAGFQYEPHLNYLIDLSQPEATLWKRLSKSCQQSVRTSRNKGVSIEIAHEPDGMEQIYGLLRLAYQRARVPLAHPSLFTATSAILGAKGMFQAFVARAQGRYIGACLVLAYRNRLIYWYGGLDRTWSAYCPMEALLWYVMQWGRSCGYSILDMGGAGRPGEPYGVRNFKAKFGGELVNYGRNLCVHAPLRYQVSQFAYRMLRRILYGGPSARLAKGETE